MPDTTFSRRLYRHPGFWFIIATTVVAGWLVFSRYGVLTRLSLEETNAQLDHDITGERQQLDSLRRWRERLVHDTLLIERLARERYGMIKPGEVVLIVADSSR
ncbi:MAG: septum formation initiator family protein [Chlorobi bacterium]|nr:septum formation initiator family protein [Chlorobiota bacterium]